MSNKFFKLWAIDVEELPMNVFGLMSENFWPANITLASLEKADGFFFNNDEARYFSF
jgi:hypothetical protein